MKRTLWIALALVAVATSATDLLQGEPTKAERGIDVPATDTAPGSVEVRHEFVTIATPAPALAAIRRSAPTRQPVRRPAPATDVWSKTARALVGDGRHRPEPFPRVK